MSTSRTVAALAVSLLVAAQLVHGAAGPLLPGAGRPRPEGDLGMSVPQSEVEGEVGAAGVVVGFEIADPCPAAAPAGAPCEVRLRSLPDGCGELSVATVEVPDRILSRLIVRVSSRCDSGVARLVRSLRPVEEPLSRLLPGSCLAAWDVGTTPAALAGALDELIHEAAPGGHGWLADRLDEARDAGVDPVTELLPALGWGVAGGLLAPSALTDDWPLPRPVWLARVSDRAAAAQAVARLLRWEAGAFADVSGGLMSARLAREVWHGVSLSHLVVDSVYETPLPSPAMAVCDGVLIASPVRSAVEEVVARIRLGRGVQPGPDVTLPAGAVAVGQANTAALAPLLEPVAAVLGRLAEMGGLPEASGGSAVVSEYLPAARLGARRWSSVGATAWRASEPGWQMLVVEGDVRVAAPARAGGNPTR